MRARARRFDRSDRPRPAAHSRRPGPVGLSSTPEATLGRAQRLGHRVDRLPISPTVQPGAIQRTFNPRGLPRTESADYIVGKAGSVLYTKGSARPPVPRGLYTFRKDKTTRGVTYYEGIPNVRFLRKSEENNSGLDVDSVTRAVERPTGRVGDIVPKLGMVGQNDCGKFANALQAMIAASGEVKPKKRKTQQIASLAQEHDEVVVEVGDKMKHFFDSSSRCNHHQATVVAKDGGDIVTLEGHVSKDLSRPEFHIRQGLPGFIEDNRQQSDRAEVQPAEANNDVGDILANFSLLKGRRDKTTKIYVLSSALAATKDVRAKLRRVRSAKELLVWLFVLVVLIVLLWSKFF